MSMHWWLAIDFGTSNTAAASYEPGSGAPQVVPLSHTSDIMSSSVYADSYRNIVVGEAAVNQATDKTLPPSSPTRNTTSPPARSRSETSTSRSRISLQPC